MRKDGGTTDVPALQESFMLTLLSNANLEWINQFRLGGGNAPLSFLRETGFDLITDTALAEATTTATTDFDVDLSTSFPASGAGIIWDDDMPDIFNYTGNAANNLTGVTGLAFAHEDGDEVQALYPLPSSFYKFRSSTSHGDGVQLDGIPLSFMSGIPEKGYFSLYDDGTNKYLWLPEDSGSASVLFDKAGATIDDIADTTDVPDESIFFLVWRIVQNASIPSEGQPTSLYATAKNEANEILFKALRNRNISKRIHVRPLSHRVSLESLYE